MFAYHAFDADLAPLSHEATAVEGLTVLDYDELALRGRRLQARAMRAFLAGLLRRVGALGHGWQSRGRA